VEKPNQNARKRVLSSGCWQERSRQHADTEPMAPVTCYFLFWMLPVFLAYKEEPTLLLWQKKGLV